MPEIVLFCHVISIIVHSYKLFQLPLCCLVSIDRSLKLWLLLYCERLQQCSQTLHVYFHFLCVKAVRHLKRKCHACTMTIKDLKSWILNFHLIRPAEASVWHSTNLSIFRTTLTTHYIQWAAVTTPKRVDSRGRKASFAVMNIYNTAEPRAPIVHPLA